MILCAQQGCDGVTLAEQVAEIPGERIRADGGENDAAEGAIRIIQTSGHAEVEFSGDAPAFDLGNEWCIGSVGLVEQKIGAVTYIRAPCGAIVIDDHRAIGTDQVDVADDFPVESKGADETLSLFERAGSLIEPANGEKHGVDLPDNMQGMPDEGVIGHFSGAQESRLLGIVVGGERHAKRADDADVQANNNAPQEQEFAAGGADAAVSKLGLRGSASRDAQAADFHPQRRCGDERDEHNVSEHGGPRGRVCSSRTGRLWFGHNRKDAAYHHPRREDGEECSHHPDRNVPCPAACRLEQYNRRTSIDHRSRQGKHGGTIVAVRFDEAPVPKRDRRRRDGCPTEAVDDRFAISTERREAGIKDGPGRQKDHVGTQAHRPYR